MRLLLSLICNALALWAATAVVRGVSLVERSGAVPTGASSEYTVRAVGALLVVAAVFMLVNALVKPVVKVLSFPLLVLTLGLFCLVVNAAMLGLTSWLTSLLVPFGAQLHVDGFWPALWGGVVVGVVNWALGLLVPERRGRD